MEQKEVFRDQPKLYEMVARIETIAQQLFAQHGSGHSESMYRNVLSLELQKLGYITQSEAPVTFAHRVRCDDGMDIDIPVGIGRMDLLVIERSTGHTLVVETKCVQKLKRQEVLAQLKRYISQETRFRNGLIINFPKPLDDATPAPREPEFAILHQPLVARTPLCT
eukprot:TRINITY_DN27568_c0_g1_i1.p1 TRINITY_DN27568_c0_g1~~TRINITY_DN27568_c0_g1_i1.p1  ORF type:complete len:180 (+),score=19.07 TRINITY_DN27568_c0_g1_i1:43-540(+)